MGWPPQSLEFDVALHLGTLAALLIYFRREWVDLTVGGLNLLRGRTADPNARMALFIVLATIPAALAGLLLEDFVESTLRSPLIIAGALIVLGLVLWVAEIRSRRVTDLTQISLADAMTIGFAQSLAVLIPGTSRSGVTITAGLFRGLKRDAASRFSFLLSAPIIAGAVAKEMFDILRHGIPADDVWPLVAGILTAGIVGYISIAFLLKYLATHSTFVFIYYRIALGLIVLIAIFWGFR